LLVFQVAESLEKADFQLVVELWFTEHGVSSQPSNVSCVSSRTLSLHFSPLTGIHYHLPVWFDYFHLSAVSLSIHGSLLAIHQSVMRWVPLIGLMISFILKNTVYMVLFL
jgi:hypothetical protein